MIKLYCQYVNDYYLREDVMLRQVMIPSKKNNTVQIPAEYYGMEVEVLVLPFNNGKAAPSGDNINDIFAKHLYSFGNFKFNRDEANNYE